MQYLFSPLWYKIFGVFAALIAVFLAVACYICSLRIRRKRIAHTLATQDDGEKPQPENVGLSNSQDDPPKVQEQTDSPLQSPVLRYPMLLHGPIVTMIAGVWMVFLGMGLDSAALLLVGFVVFFVAAIVDRISWKGIDTRQYQNRLLNAVTATLALFMVAFLCSALHCRQVNDIMAEYTYLGPMRVVGFETEVGYDGFWNKYGQQQRCLVPENIVSLHVAFGGEWACPESPDTECVATVDSYFCDYPVCGNETDWCPQTCTDDDLYEAQNASEACMESLYGETLDLIDIGVEYDPDVPPDQDPNDWQWHRMYGNCETCTAEFSFDVESQHSALWILPFYICLAVIGGLACGIWSLRLWRRESEVSSDGLIQNQFATSA